MYIGHISHVGKIQSCKDHCRNTAEIAGNLLCDIGLYSTAYLAGLLHDMGKFTSEFTDYIKNAVNENTHKSSVIHSFAGVSYLMNNFHCRLKGSDEVTFHDITAEIISIAVGSHHGLFDCCNEYGENGFLHRIEKQTEYDIKASKAFLSECADHVELLRLFANAEKEITEKLSHLASIACEDSEIGDSEICFYAAMLARLLTSAVVDGDRRDTTQFMEGRNISEVYMNPALWEQCSKNIEVYISKFQHNTAIQIARQCFSDEAAQSGRANTSGIYRLELPTGGGKTITALRYAVEHARVFAKKRIFYVAPLLTIIEQNVKIIQEAVGKDIPVLEHHSSILRENISSDELHTTELLQETWGASIVVTTLVRMLDTFFSGKMSDIRRFNALCDSIIIFDEIQSLPTKMTSMFNLMMNFLAECCNANIVLCSATQPAFEITKHAICLKQGEIISKETLIKNAHLFKRTEIINEGSICLKDLPSYATDIMRHTKSLLVVCNTKREAVSLFHEINIPDVKKYHLSAGMCTTHRRKILTAMNQDLKNKAKVICVSTQVIEAGIDISFNEIIRLSAGLDSIVQAAGRCNRNGENDLEMPVHIVHISDENLGKLKEIARAQQALNALLAEYSTSPERFGCDLASNDSVSYYYRQLFKNMPRDALDYSLKELPTMYSLLSDNDSFRIRNKDKLCCFYEQAFRTACKNFEVFDERTDEILVPYMDGERIIAELNSTRAKYDIGYTRGLLKEAKAYTVNVFHNTLSKIEKEGGISAICDNQIYVLKPGWYDDNTGLIENTEKEGRKAECDILIL